MLLQTWLFVGERDGVSFRQPETKALKRAISVLKASDSVPAAIIATSLAGSHANASRLAETEARDE